MSYSLWPHSLQHARLSCPWLFPRVLRFMSIEFLMLYDYFILPHPLLLLPSIFPSIRVFSNELALRIRWPKYWTFSISSSNEYSGLISLGLTGLISLLLGSPDQGTLKSLLKNHNSKASVLWCSAIFMVQLSHLYMTTGKTIALTTSSFVSQRRQWHPTPVLLPGKSHGWRSLVVCSPWGC